ncbi:hypothetical protein RFI_16259 [Reticulomyxa filosa]|uniref:FAD-binding FR-type domain-containing protein n=1 Tax=Reticulomyxa filosa TaxID=46433 RepID=X6N4M0_RETFI|nr:hypothetical protein RFI_16259 [Reticulomyxa filosa]|eukprot:ETO20946.1 hypothetical protein RFI_16259 [Reticulomyxa filosa]
MLGKSCCITLFELFSKHLDICGVPRRTFFERLVHFTDNPLHIDKLREFCSSEGQLALYEYNQLEHRSYVEVLEDFHSCKVPIEWLIQFIPRLQPRKFSISSCCEYYRVPEHCVANGVFSSDACKQLPVVSVPIVECTVALVEYETPLKRKRFGVCSQFIQTLPLIDPSHGESYSDNDHTCFVPIGIIPGSFRLNRDAFLQKKVIMIGPGTGIAPFRSMCQQRYFHWMNHRNNLDNSDPVESVMVFFGNRNADKDFFFEHEWSNWTAKGQTDDNNTGACVEYFATAFSRDVPNKKVYVTHKMKEYGKIIWEWITKYECLIFVAGSSRKMPTDVQNTLIAIVQEHGNMTSEDAEKFIRFLERTYRYQSETWSVKKKILFVLFGHI